MSSCNKKSTGDEHSGDEEEINYSELELTTEQKIMMAIFVGLGLNINVCLVLIHLFKVTHVYHLMVLVAELLRRGLVDPSDFGVTIFGLGFPSHETLHLLVRFSLYFMDEIGRVPYHGQAGAFAARFGVDVNNPSKSGELLVALEKFGKEFVKGKMRIDPCYEFIFPSGIILGWMTAHELCWQYSQ